MKRFAFPLERLLQLRASAEREQARRLGSARDAEAEARAHAEQCERQLAEAMDQMATSDARPAGTLCNLTLALEQARARSAAAAAAHRDALGRAEAERAAFDEARQARRAIEKLREQRHEAWTQAVARTEQQTLDEVALRMRPGKTP